MKVLLVYPDIHTLQLPHFQHGLASISAVLKSAGHSTALLYLTREITEDEFLAAVSAYHPDLVGFSTNTLQFPFVRRYAGALKAALPIKVVIGGIHPTISPETVISEPCFDVLVRGEGEYPLLEYLQALSQGSEGLQIPNLWLRRASGEIIRNPLRPPLDLEQLPFPDRDLFDNEVLMRENGNQVAMMASRGCPFACTFCCNTALANLVGGGKKLVRQRRVASVLAEIEYLARRFPDMKSLLFMDEIFTHHKDWLREFCAGYRQRFRYPFQIFLRVETVDRETLERLKDAGLYSIIVGVESGSERIRREVLNRRMSNEQILRVFQWADELGIETWNSNIIGLPGETEAEVRETMELNRQLRPHHVQVSIFYPFPGTPLYDFCRDQGYTQLELAPSFFLSQPSLNLPDLPPEKLRELFQEFQELALQIESEKGAQGYQDLAVLFPHADLHRGGEKFTGRMRIRILGEDRICLLLHPPSRAGYTLTIRPDSVLRFGLAFSPDVWDKPGGGCLYRVKVKMPWRKEKVVFEREFDPKHRPEERGWVDAEVDLSEFRGKTVTLTLETATQGPNDYCVAFWSRPYLVQKHSAPAPERRNA